MPLFDKMEIRRIHKDTTGDVVSTDLVGHHWFRLGTGPVGNDRVPNEFLGSLPPGEYRYFYSGESVVNSRCPQGRIY